MPRTATRNRIDSVTKHWIRNASDELAVRNGCRFDEGRGQFVVDWIQTYCRLYEGEHAGQALILSDWQLDVTMRLFGWVRWSDHWQREIRRFREASVWVPKKNKKSPTLAAWGLYLLCGDGEPGQKVYLAAKDGSQAREIAGKHCVEMMEQSDELQEECNLNKSLLQITHEPSRSILKPLSSGSERTKQAKEGLNGSVLIDEVHVVDREFVDRISRAGISRSEPLMIEVSTAGDNPDGYGKERFDHAVQVEAGHVEDEALFVAIYAAPQDLSDKDLDADPLKWGRLANPAMGHTVNSEEFLADYQKSKSSASKLAIFKKYRLNIWQNSSNPWLNLADWQRCHKAYTEEDMLGQPCVAGLDLSKTRDFTALSYAFPLDQERVRFILRFFLPEAIVERYSDIQGIETWQDEGNLIITPGDVIDYGYIRSTFQADVEKFDVRMMVFDPWGAEQTTQELEQGVLDRDGNEVIAGTGVPRFAFKQTIAMFAEATEEFERRVIAQKIEQNGNPVLSWQIGHTNVWTDANGNMRPIKPKRGDRRTIDGVVASIMSFSQAIKLDLCARVGVQTLEQDSAESGDGDERPMPQSRRKVLDDQDSRLMEWLEDDV